MTNEEALQSFKRNVCDRAEEVDPDDQYDWFSLSMGYFLAIGCTLNQAHNLSLDARYKEGYWVK
jgi:hypothetical protein